MNPSHTTHLKAYNPDTSCNELTGESLNVHSLAKPLTLEDFAALLEDYLNLGGKGYCEGCEIGSVAPGDLLCPGADRSLVRVGVRRSAQ